MALYHDDRDGQDDPVAVKSVSKLAVKNRHFREETDMRAGSRRIVCSSPWTAMVAMAEPESEVGGVWRMESGDGIVSFGALEDFQKGTASSNQLHVPPIP